MATSQDVLAYEKRCEAEVIKILGIEFNYGSNSRPVLEFSLAKSPWTEERLLQFTNLYIQQDTYDYGSRLLLEAFALSDCEIIDVAWRVEIFKLMKKQKDDLRRKGISATGDYLYDLRQKLPKERVPLLYERKYQEFLHWGWSHAKGLEASSPKKLVLLQERLNTSEALHTYIDFSGRRSEMSPLSQGPYPGTYAIPFSFESSPRGGPFRVDKTFDPPFLAGLRRILSQQIRKYQGELLQAIREWVPVEHEQVIARSKSTALEKSEEVVDAKLNFVFSPSGSGKTTSIFNRLLGQYGYYMMASALGSDEPDSDIQQQNILDPKKINGVSKDTRELLKMLKHFKKLDNLSGLSSSPLRSVCKTWWSSILVSRAIVFGAFRKAKGSKSTSEMWLLFQVNCEHWDPFLQVFRAIAFSLDHRLLDHYLSEEAPSLLEGTQVEWSCIDEAQEDLRCETQRGENLLGCALDAFYGTKLESLPFRNFERMIFAGTAFNITEALQAGEKQIAEMDSWVMPYESERDITFRTITTYQHVRSDSHTKQILQNCGLNSERALQEASKFGSSLQGRVKWTAMFADRILDAMTTSNLPNSEACELSERQIQGLDFRRLADDTYENIVEQLINKLRLIQGRRNGRELLRGLLDAAISADIRNSSHKFQQECDLELVEHGFAMVGRKLDKVKDELEPNFDTTFNDMERFELVARRKEHCMVEDGIADLLIKAAGIRFAVEDWSLNKLTPDMWSKGFTVVDCRPSTVMSPDEAQANADNQVEEKQASINEVIDELGRQNKKFAPYVDKIITLESSGGHRLIRMKIDGLFSGSIANQLTQRLTQNDLFITDKTINRLKDFMNRGFIVKDTSLIAELKERVVIDAVLRFSSVDSLENSLLSQLDNLSLGELGNPAEYYLAVQIQLFFGGTAARESPQKSEEWEQRRDRVIAALAKTENGVAEQPTQIGDLSTSTLVTGEQTVKRFESWEEWTVRFAEWLNAVQAGYKPCASFLLPYNDFGPDLVFALRTLNDIILCSVQLKLGTCESGDAVDKASISWACVGRRTSIDKRLTEFLKDKPQYVIDFYKRTETLPEDFLGSTEGKVRAKAIALQREAKQRSTLHELEQQLQGFWRYKSKLSMLIAIESPKKLYLHERRPCTRCDTAYEYYNFIYGNLATDLFGRGFQDLLDRKKAR